MNKSFLLLCNLIGIALFSFSLNAQVAAGDIDLQQVSNNISVPTGICQCDTIRVRYELKPNSNFSATSDFVYQFANPVNAWSTALDLELVALFTDPNANPPVQATSVLDTFSPGLLWADLVVPCNASLFGSSFRIINIDNVGNITANGASDTAFFNVNRIPTLAAIDSVALIQSGVRLDTFDNPYTTNLQDVGFCEGDSVFLRVENDGNAYQWYNGRISAPIIGATDDSLLVSGSGFYFCEVIDGPCSIFSDTVIVNRLITPTQIAVDLTLAANAGVTEADNPDFTAPNRLPIDSIELCESSTALLQGPLVPPNTGLTFSYQWLTDSFNTVTGLRDTFPIVGATGQNLTVGPNNSRLGFNQYWVVVNDGFCSDTTLVPRKVLVDSIPVADIVGIPFPGLTGPTVPFEICMRDSVLLATQPTEPTPDWKYSWQWYDPTVPAGGNPWRSVSGNPSGSLTFDTNATLKVDTSLSDPGQPYFQSPKPAIRYFRVRIATRTVFTNQETCVYFSDSVAVRWFPDYSLQLAPNQPQVNIIGPDSISFCEDITATVQAPATPTELSSFGYNYTYQWLSDSVDQNLGQRVKYALAGETNQTLDIDSSGNYFVVLDDGICLDTSRVYRAFVDTLPTTTLQEVEFPGGSSLTNFNLCLYDSALVSATDSTFGLLPWHYQWQQFNPVSGNWLNLVDDTLVSFQIDTSYKRVGEDTAYFRLATSYTNRFGFENCQSITDSIMVIFYQSPNVSFIPGDSVGVCPGDSILFVAQGNFTSFSWQNGQVLSASRYINAPGTYPVEATGVNGCITFDTVTVFPLTVNAAAGPDQTINSGEQAQLSASGGTEYRWYASEPLEFSDMLSQNITVSKILPDGVNADTITIYVEVTNNRGCSGLDSLRLIITRNIPDAIADLSKAYNIFTPNGDGLNDIWDITDLVDGDNCELVVLNRWGSTIYEDESFNGQWSGVDNGGNDLPDGTYYYILNCEGEVRMKNAVTIIRNQ
jgi:gliding motility-associated-like protein